MAVKQTFEFWDWLRDKVVPSLVIALVLGVGASYVQLQRLIDAGANTAASVAELRGEVSAIKEGYVRRAELTEILKRVEQQQELMLLKMERKGAK